MDTPLENTTSLKDITSSKALVFLSIIALLVIIYLAKSIFLPILVAGFMALFASPAVKLLIKLNIPRALASLIVVVLLMIILGYLFSLLIEPALRWIEAAPGIGDRIVREFEQARMPIVNVAMAEDAAVGQAMNSTLVRAASALAESSLVLVTQIAAIIVLIYFFLAYGEELMRNIIKVQESFAEKKLTVVMFHAVRDDVSMYILLVTLINIGLGLCFAATLKLINFEDALLWGTLAAVLNYAPYIGPLVLAAILTSVGFVEGESMHQVLLAPGLFLILNLIEGQFITPTILGKRFNINPLLVVLWMFLWGWLWGIAGMLLAIPMLMCFKLISVHLNIIGNWVEIFNGNYTENDPVRFGKKRSIFAIFTKKPLDHGLKPEESSL